MIPAFNDNGYLPPGVYPATLAEIEASFGRESELRQVQMESIRWLVDLARRAGVQRIILNGSFVTDIMEPNDVDCVLLMGRGIQKDPAAKAELKAGVPFLELKLVRERVFNQYIALTFGTDRMGIAKGMIEIIL